MYKNNLLIKYFSTNNGRRVVVSGLGMVSPLGINYKESWENLVNSKSGITDMTNHPDGKNLPTNNKFAAPIPKSFDGSKYRTLGTDNLLTQITVSASDEAIENSNLVKSLSDEKMLKYRIVCIFYIIF